MDPDGLITSLQEALPGVSITGAPSVDQHPTIFVPRDQVLAAAQALRDRPDLAFDVLVELTACDFWPQEPRFEVVYVLLSTSLLHRARIKVRLGGDDPRVADVSGVWPAADWLEREVWDLFGIVFDGHADLRRLLMPEDWTGHPLRKDYPVQIRMAARTTQPLQVTEQEFRANIERDRVGRHEH